MATLKKTADASSATLTAGLSVTFRHMNVVCNSCGSLLPDAPRWAGAYSCRQCDSWTMNMRFESANPLCYRGAS